MSNPEPPMPAGIAEVYRPLRGELVNIHVQWRLFLQLYGTDPDRIELLNRFAGGLFGVVQEVLYDDLVLAVFRLHDPAKSGKFENLSLPSLVGAVRGVNSQLAASLARGSGDLVALLDPYAEWRNKRIAHNDLETAKAQYFGSSPLEGPSREVIARALAIACGVLNEVAAAYGEGETRYGEVILAAGDGDALVRHLNELSTRNDK